MDEAWPFLGWSLSLHCSHMNGAIFLELCLWGQEALHIPPPQQPLPIPAPATCVFLLPRIFHQRGSPSESPFYFVFLAHHRVESLNYLEPGEQFGILHHHPQVGPHGPSGLYYLGWEGLNSVVSKLRPHTEFQCPGLSANQLKQDLWVGPDTGMFCVPGDSNVQCRLIIRDIKPCQPGF